METADVEGDVIQCLACRLRLALHTRILPTGTVQFCGVCTSSGLVIILDLFLMLRSPFYVI